MLSLTMQFSFASVPAVTTARSGSGFVVGLATVLGQHYRVEWTDSLVSQQWNTLLDNIAGNGGTIPVTDFNVGNAAQRYYRVIVL